MTRKQETEFMNRMRARCEEAGKQHLIKVAECAAKHYGLTPEQHAVYYAAIKDLPPSLPGKRKGTMLPVPVHDIGMAAVRNAE